jgi:hypothetical protein
VCPLHRDTRPADSAPFLGAHEIPDEYRGRVHEYADLVVHDMLTLLSGFAAAQLSVEISDLTSRLIRQTFKSSRSERSCRVGGPVSLAAGRLIDSQPEANGRCMSD